MKQKIALIIALPHSSDRAVVSALLLLALLVMSPLHALNATAQPQQPLTVFVVRHAEKVKDGGDDPDLNVAGRLRAAELAVLLRDSGISHVHSTNRNRTRNTAAPVATQAGLQTEDYDGGGLADFVARVRETGGRHLIVGHGNTIGETVELLGGKPGSAVDEGGEYDRLYVVTVGTNGEVSTVLMRYGSPYLGG